LLITAHELAKSRRKAWHPCLHFGSVFFALSSYFAVILNPGRPGLLENIFTRGDGENCLQGKEHQNLLRTDHPPGNNDLFVQIAMTAITTFPEPLPKQGLR
jgi:hypothetical protein